MIEYRAFRNTDPPHLVDIWNQQVSWPGLMQPLTLELLDSEVLSKPFFDRQGLIVAVENQTPIGFIHAAFGPTDDGNRLDCRVGVICLLMVRPDKSSAIVARELIAHAERYLVQYGAESFQGGAASPRAPFYEGLYGGALCPGVVAEDHQLINALEAAGYQFRQRRTVMRCSAAAVRPVIDRNTMQVRRSCQVQTMIDPPSASWWEACTDAWQQRFRFMARARADGRELAHITFRNTPVANRPGAAAGLSQWRVFDADNQESLVLFLLGEAIRQLRSEGIEAIEAHVGPDQESLAETLERLRFSEVGQGLIFSRSA